MLRRLVQSEWYCVLYSDIDGGGKHDAIKVVQEKRAGVPTLPATWWQKASLSCLVRTSASVGVVVSALGVIIVHNSGLLGEMALVLVSWQWSKM